MQPLTLDPIFAPDPILVAPPLPVNCVCVCNKTILLPTVLALIMVQFAMLQTKFLTQVRLLFEAISNLNEAGADGALKKRLNSSSRSWTEAPCWKGLAGLELLHGLQEQPPSCSRDSSNDMRQNVSCVAMQPLAVTSQLGLITLNNVMHLGAIATLNEASQLDLLQPLDLEDNVLQKLVQPSHWVVRKPVLLLRKGKPTALQMSEHPES